MLWIFILPILFNFANCELQNLDVVRSVDLNTQLVKVKTKIVIKALDNSYILNYTYFLDSDVTTVNYIKFTNKEGNELFYTEVPVKIHELNNTIRAAVVSFGKLYTKFNLYVEEEQALKIKILQKRKLFNSQELVKYQGNLLYFSPYDTLHYENTYNVSKLEFVNIQPYLKTNNSLNYKFPSPIKKFSIESFDIDFISDSQFLHVLNLERQIDISLYGKIMVADIIELKNTGAKVHGAYKPSKLTWFYTHLPASAEVTNLYDDIGKIYTWQLLEYNDYRTLKFRPRYVLQGGWKTTYNLKYTVPTYEYIKITAVDQYEINMRAVDHVLNNIIVDKFTTRLVLPENAVVHQIFIPPLFTRLPDEEVESPLTSSGRRSIVFTGANVLEKHIQNFAVEYSVDSINLLSVPLKLSVAFYGFFIFIIMNGRREPLTLRGRPWC